jgi:glycosyltransferase involved in cell wall biosynthesis
MKVSLIITTYNWIEALKLTLLSVQNQTILPDEIIIADDGSREETKSFIDEIRKSIAVPLIHVWQEDNGYQRTLILNEAVRNSSCDYIVQTDGDIIFHPSFLEEHKRIAEEGYFIKGSRCLLGKDATENAIKNKKIVFNPFSADIKNRLNAMHLPLLSPLFYYRDTKSISGLTGCNMAYWKNDFVKVNGYDNDIVGWGREDSELAVRWINSGVGKKRAKFVAVCYHQYHNFLSRENDERNISMLNKAIEDQRIECENGYNTTHQCIVYK